MALKSEHLLVVAGVTFMVSAWVGLLVYTWCLAPWQAAVPVSLGWGWLTGHAAMRAAASEPDKRPDHR